MQVGYIGYSCYIYCTIYLKIYTEKRIVRKSKLERRASQILFNVKKKFYHFFKPHAKKKDIAFIIGCQRSGTTMMHDIFTNDLNTQTYGEFSKLSSLDKLNKIRLNPLDSVKKDIEKVNPSFIVLKPLVESQNILNLLDFFDGSKAIWMYRNYQDIASSNRIRFGVNTGINDLRPIVEDMQDNWRSEKVSKAVREVVLQYFSKDMNPYDAAVLFWYARNCLYFELNLDKNPNIIICRYEDLVVSPGKIIKSLYKNLNQDFPGAYIYKEVDSTSLRKGKNVELTPEINKLAKDLLDKLDNVYQTKNEEITSVA